MLQYTDVVPEHKLTVLYWYTAYPVPERRDVQLERFDSKKLENLRKFDKIKNMIKNKILIF